MQKVVDDILTLSKLDSDLLQITPVLAQPLDVIRQALNIFDRQARQSGIQLTFKPSSSIVDLNVAWVWLDPNRVLQVLMNLLTNAIKFTADQPERVITISLDASLDINTFTDQDMRFLPSGKVSSTSVRHGTDGKEVYLLFCVSDTGRGISPEEQDRLFKRFSQASIRTHVDYGGSGLGLWISRQLTEMQGGEIGIVPNTSKGSVFAFYIRAEMAQAPEQTTAITKPELPILPSEQTISLNSRPKQVRVFDLTQLEVLLVEDNLINQRVLQKQLQKLFKVVHVANHGVEALEALRRTGHWKHGIGSNDAPEIALVLLDVEMPVMGGVECVKTIRNYEETDQLTVHIPVIGTTGMAYILLDDTY